MHGYKHKSYVESYSSIGRSIHLSNCNGWLINHPISNTNFSDLSGAYPLFFCDNLSLIEEDFNCISSKDFISVVFVSNQINNNNAKEIQEKFNLCRPFKEHYIAKLDQPWEKFVRRSMKRYTKKAFHQFNFSLVDNNNKYVNILWQLFVQNTHYDVTSNQQHLSQKIIKKQLSVPGVKMFLATYKGEIHGIACYVEVDSQVYGHLIGCTQFGKSNHIIYGLYGYALNYYYKKKASIDFGSNIGLINDAKCGLSLFKSGWCNDKQTVYLCGKILNPEVYLHLVQKSDVKQSSYFPAYRKPY